MSDAARQIRNEVAKDIGANVAYLTPKDEKRFDPATVLLVAGAAAIAFLKGVVTGAATTAGKLAGAALVTYVVDQFKEARGKDQEQQLAEMEAELKRLEEMVRADQAFRQTWGDGGEVEAALVAALRKEGFPPDIAERLAQRVKQTCRHRFADQSRSGGP